MSGEYEVKYEVLVPYHQTAMQPANKFEEFYINHVPRYENTYVDTLASLAATLAVPSWSTKHVTISSRKLVHSEAIMGKVFFFFQVEMPLSFNYCYLY